MLLACLVTLTSVILPVLLLVWLIPHFRARAFSFVYLGVIIQTGAIAIVASVVKFPNAQLARSCLVLLAATFLTGTWLCWVRRGKFLTRVDLRPRLIAVFLGVALLMVLDQFVIHAKNRFGFETNFLFPKNETYFRPPLYHDSYRNAALVAGVARGSTSPFLPNAPLTYQLFWHHFASVFVAPLNAPSIFGPVSGVTLATSFLFHFILIASVCLLRPTLFLRPRTAAPLLVIFACHAEVLELTAGMVKGSFPAIEADWSLFPILGSTFSFKAIALSAPQHLCFLLFLLPFFVVHPRSVSRRDSVLSGTFVFLAALASPILSMTLFPVFGIFEIAKSLKRGGFWIVVTALSFFAFWALWKFPPHELFLRESVHGFATSVRHSMPWYGLPFTWLGTEGLLGLVLSVLVLSQLKRRRVPWNPLFGFLFILTPSVHFFSRQPEIARHWTMVAVAVTLVWIVRYLPHHPIWRRGVALAAVAAVVCHLAFLYGYLGKPSQIDPSIPVSDYLALGRKLAERGFHEPVLAARGDMVSPMIETRTSFASTTEALIHSSLSPLQARKLSEVYHVGMLPYAKIFHYEWVVWGPIEEAAWGPALRARFVGDTEALERVGEVGLYPIIDHLASHPGMREGATAREIIELAEVIAENGWHWESYYVYQRALNLDPSNGQFHRTTTDPRKQYPSASTLQIPERRVLK